MTPTDKVLGSIAAIQTLIENFPMSILDNIHGKTYTSLFDFMVDVLNACGVNTNDILDYLLNEIYGLEIKVEGGIQGLYDQIASKAIEIDEQNDFLQKLEMAIKKILQALLMSVFTCSAIPIIPNKMFDGDDLNELMDDATGNLIKKHDFDRFIVPTKAIDIMGMLNLCPTSSDGNLYYAIEGGDKYYHKVEVPVTTYEDVTRIETATTDEVKTITENHELVVPKYRKCASLVFQIIYECDGKYDEVEWKPFIDKIWEWKYDEEQKKGEWISGVTKTLDEDLTVYVSANKYGEKTATIQSVTIKKGQRSSSDVIFLCPKDDEKPPKASILNYISINNIGPACSTKMGSENVWVYFDKERSKSCCEACYGHGDGTPIEKPDSGSHWNNIRYHRLMKWNSLWQNMYNWGTFNNETEVSAWTTTREETVKKNETYEVTETIAHTTYEYQYQECSLEEASEGENICRVNIVPTEGIKDDDCDYIVYYDGLNPNTLYKTMDMNAFIWYVLNKGMTYPQNEYNHMMWDSRVSAAKIGVGRTNAEDWNDWYNTKETENGEFLYDPFKTYGMPSYITDKDPLYPIIQLEPWGTSGQYLAVYIPSQRYFRPRKREALITNMGGEETVKVPKHAFNASIYKFNWDYLMGIQILHPKILIVGMCEHLLGFALSTVSSLNFNFTRKLIKSKISKAIKNIVEANDMEVADCYMSFSNDEFNDMLQEMLMARYGATNYGGENTPAKSHDITSYISNLEGVNSSSSVEGNVTQIKKLITEVTADPTTEPTIEYGLQVETDGNLLQKLLWALAMPIIEAIFTPQVVLLLLINFELMGVTKMDDFLDEDYGKILNLLLNKLLGLTKAIVLFIKDKIIELLFKFFYEKVLPILIKYKLLLILERLEYWLMILKAAVECLPLYKFKRKKIIGQIDDVDYADIINDQTTPESTTDSC